MPRTNSVRAAHQPAADSELITIGKVVRPHGVRGMLRVMPLTDVPTRFEQLKSIRLRTPGGQPVSFEIERVQIHADAVLLKLRNIDSRNQVDALRNAEIVIERKDCLPLDDDAYYVFDLIGLQVVTTTGKPVGKIEDILAYPAHDVYVVSYGDTEYLIPAVKAIVKEIDLARSRMIIDPLPGLLPE